MVEKYLIEHCAPTLASLKTANLFNYPFEDEASLQAQLYSWNQQMRPSGVELSIVKKRPDSALIYVFRREKLRQDLQKSGVRRFLMEYGYEDCDVDKALRRLKQRLAVGEEFPHEIGLFLGYPLGDVIGFIHNAGKNCKYTGCWKVYCNECEALRTFAKYKKCSEVYRRLWEQGRSVLQLTVAA